MFDWVYIEISKFIPFWNGKNIGFLLCKVKFASTYQTGYEHQLKRYCFGYPEPYLKNPDPETARQNICQTLSFWVTAEKLTVLESLNLTDFKSVFRYLVRCLDPDLYCLDPDSSNVGRVSQHCLPTWTLWYCLLVMSLFVLGK